MASQQQLPVLLARDGSERRIPVIAPPISSDYSPDIGGNKILFLHPGYGPAINAIFSLPCVDRKGDGTHGVHHQTALTACRIVANNASNGYLALDAKGDRRVDEIEDVLTGNSYYFIVPGDERYPIVPSFRDWQFPHQNIPSSWPQLPNAETSSSDGLCTITKFPWALTKAHIVPSAQADWFNKNGMHLYDDSTVPDIDGANNIMILKRDIHDCFDQFMFALVPKPRIPQLDQTAVDTVSTQSRADHRTVTPYTIHVLANNQPLFASLHHDIQLPHLKGVAREYLLARFALAIFIKVKPFINLGYKRRVARFRIENEDRGPEVICEEVDGPELHKQYGGGKSRSASPSKRKRPGAEAGEDDMAFDGVSTPELYEGAMDDTESSDESIRPGSVEGRTYIEEMEEEERGRRRKRKRILCNDFVDGAVANV
ncbi:hypothetical protein PT974_00068 [Cladobotryum mycophilum]|uniref:HNH nuclease domain-containing protein n=1 Tax=Cladobotryum mycophilum TaxID=491253 RepID=A0ABR0T0Q3_9HYPO